MLLIFNSPSLPRTNTTDFVSVSSLYLVYHVFFGSIMCSCANSVYFYFCTSVRAEFLRLILPLCFYFFVFNSSLSFCFRHFVFIILEPINLDTITSQYFYQRRITSLHGTFIPFLLWQFFGLTILFCFCQSRFFITVILTYFLFL